MHASLITDRYTLHLLWAGSWKQPYIVNSNSHIMVKHLKTLKGCILISKRAGGKTTKAKPKKFAAALITVICLLLCFAWLFCFLFLFLFLLLFMKFTHSVCLLQFGLVRYSPLRWYFTTLYRNMMKTILFSNGGRYQGAATESECGRGASHTEQNAHR